MIVEPNEAVRLLKEGKIVALPTETVFGLAAPIFDERAIEEVFAVKGRPSDNPLIAHISHLHQIEQIARNLSGAFYQLASAFFPGPLTVVVEKRADVPGMATAGLDTIAVRMPSHTVARQIIAELGQPIVAPSANLSGRPSSTCAEHVIEDFGDKLPVVEGECCCGLESSVISLVGEPTLLRPGTITKEQIEKVLGRSIDVGGDSGRPQSPGMKYRHYCPQAHVRFVEDEQAAECGEVVLTHLDAKTLYARLRACDRKGAEKVAIVIDEKMRADVALMNRLSKMIC